MDLLNEKQPRELDTLSCLTDVVLGFIYLQNHTTLKRGLPTSCIAVTA